MTPVEYTEVGKWLAEVARLSQVLNLGDGCTAMRLSVRLELVTQVGTRSPGWVVELQRGHNTGAAVRAIGATAGEACAGLLVQSWDMLARAIEEKRRELAELEHQALGAGGNLTAAPEKCRACDDLRHNPDTGRFYCGTGKAADCARGQS